MGPAVAEFEENFAAYCGVKYAVGLSSGTDALFLALKVLGIGEGDEVITVPNTFLATVGAIVQAGASPRLVDAAEDYNIDPAQIEAAINDKTRAIIPVHLTGNPARMEEINALARRQDLFVIEDAAQAVGADIGGKKTGSFGEMGVFSLHPLKNLNTCGDGGMLTTDSETYYRELLLSRNHGLKDRNESKFFAYNCRLDSIKAAVGNLQLMTIDKVNDGRIRNARLYDEGLSDLKDKVKIPPRRSGVRQVFHTYIVQAERRAELIEFLKEKGIETKIHYPIPIHLMEAAQRYGYKKGDFPVAEGQAEKILSLPVQHHLHPDQVEYVVDSIREYYRAG